ncbi:MAG: hypothetical protein FJY99_02735 [Candidatus Sericytochromatia bacterium]|nr:hypothetical protein [Candidatus Tanganyikabacteria bacterium]
MVPPPPPTEMGVANGEGVANGTGVAVGAVVLPPPPPETGVAKGAGDGVTVEPPVPPPASTFPATPPFCLGTVPLAAVEGVAEGWGVPEVLRSVRGVTASSAHAASVRVKAMQVAATIPCRRLDRVIVISIPRFEVSGSTYPQAAAFMRWRTVQGVMTGETVAVRA